MLIRRAQDSSCTEVGKDVRVFGAQGVVKELILVDRQKDKVKGEMMDLRHGSSFMLNPFIYAGSDYAVCAKSRLIVVTVGARRKPGESRLALVQKNADMFKKIIPDLVKHSPDCILLIVTNPVPVWSGVNVSGVRLRDLYPELGTPDDKENWNEVHEQVIKRWTCMTSRGVEVPVWSGVTCLAWRLRDLYPALGTPDDKGTLERGLHEQVTKEVIKMKGYTSWAIALSVSALARSILYHMGHTCAVSTAAK
ncbi:Lactate dehydrogenase, partial [Gryllus bimaculatus]